MEQFVYSVSHDLKSPLVSLTGFVECLQEDVRSGDAASVEESVGRIRNNVHRMEQCIKDLPELSRVGRIPHEPEPVDVKTIVALIVEDMSQRIDEPGCMTPRAGPQLHGLGRHVRPGEIRRGEPTLRVSM